jgi:hypothetical protein
VSLVVFLWGAIQVFKRGLDTLRGGDLDDFLDTSLVRAKSFGDLLPGPVRHVNGLPSVSGHLGLVQTVREVIWAYGYA